MKRSSGSDPFLWLGGFAFLTWVGYQHTRLWTALARPEFLTGWTLIGLMTLLVLFNLRKRLPMFPVAPASFWLTAHLILGLMAMAVFWLHTGSLWPAGSYERLLAGAFYLLSLTGIVGYLLQKLYPPHLAESGVEVIYERVPVEIAYLRKKAEALVLACTATTGSDTLARHYMENFSWYFLSPRFRFNHLFTGDRGDMWVKQRSTAVRRYLDDQETIYLDKLDELARYKTAVDFHYAAQSVMKGWLLIHVPLAAAVMVLSLWHLILIHVYAR